MKILVVGGAGYIGSHVCRELLDQGHMVTVFDNLSSGHRSSLFSEAAFIEGDILDAAAIDAAFALGFEAFIHLAAAKAAGESMTNPAKYSTQNIAGSINILNAATAHNVPFAVFSSTAAVYGAPKYLPIDEDHPTEPENYYGFTKLEIERILSWYSRLKGIRYAALRYFNAAGYDAKGRCTGLERNPANLLPVTMEAAVGTRPSLQVFGDDYDTRDGTGLRDYIHVSDLARGHVAALDYLVRTREDITVNLGSENGVTVKEMVDTARRITGREIPIKIEPRRAGDPATVLATSKKAHELLGWKAVESDVESLIASTWGVYKVAFEMS